jgi:poly(3-hydroxybutyrate) depolymerase
MKNAKLALLLLFGACGPTVPAGGAGGGGGTADAGASADAGSAPVVNPYGSFDNCPTLATGTVTYDAVGTQRTVEVQLPENPEGAPVVFAWHWLGGSATQILDFMRMRQLADAGYIVIAPESTGLQVEWDFSSTDSRSNVDLGLIDTILGCAFDELAIDTQSVYATGMSAGGLMSTFLTMVRADVFAATAPFSGGVSRANYISPSQTIPVLLTWGGPTDTYNGFSFETVSLSFAAALEEDGNPVYPCVHSAGHLPPREAASMVELFFNHHRLGEPSLWADGIPDAMPDFCER